MRGEGGQLLRSAGPCLPLRQESWLYRTFSCSVVHESVSRKASRTRTDWKHRKMELLTTETLAHEQEHCLHIKPRANQRYAPNSTLLLCCGHVRAHLGSWICGAAMAL